MPTTDAIQNGYINHAMIEIQANAMARLYLNTKAEGEVFAPELTAFSRQFKRVGFPNSKVKNVPRWYRRSLLRDARQRLDYAHHEQRLIGAEKSRIVSSPVLASRRYQRAKQMAYLENTEVFVVGADGEELAITCADIYKTPRKIFGKHYVRMKGLEKFSLEQSLIGYFLTLTLPPEWHPNPKNGNNSWEGASPGDGHRELQRKWRNWQVVFGKTMFVRVEEQHEDGTPHWHILVWIKPEDEALLLKKFAQHFGMPPAADIRKIDLSKGTGTSYLSKYVLATLGTGSAMHAETAELADAHRATWGGRMIQISDLKGSSTIWDELRRLKVDAQQWSSLTPIGKDLHACAVSNNYCNFLTILKSMSETGRTKILYEKDETGHKLIKGVRVDFIDISTREKKWGVRPKNG
ncbi:replication endonuclease [Duganella callida]|nr:replication endonuclease [Duganella callida]